MQPLQYAIYKGTGGKFGAVQFNQQIPHYYRDKTKDFSGALALEDTGKLKDGWNRREGAVFMEIAPTKDKNIYDWENKVIIALSVTDMGKILHALVTGEKCTIMHDPGAKSETQGAVKKFLNIESPNGTIAGVMLSVTQTTGGDKRGATVPLTGDEVLVLKQLLQSAVSRALAW